MTMTMKALYGKAPKKSGPDRPSSVVVRVTNPRTKVVCEFTVPTTLDGEDQAMIDETIEKLLGIFEKWGYWKPEPETVLLPEELLRHGEAISAELERAVSLAEGACPSPEDLLPAPEEQTPAPDPDVAP